MKTRVGQLLVTAFPETKLRRRSGNDIVLAGKSFALPEVATKPRHIGYVVGIGRGVSGIDFGDLVELRVYGSDAGIFLNVPRRDLCGMYRGSLTYLNPDGPGEVKSEPDDKLMAGRPEMILWRRNTLKGLHNGAKSIIEPMFDRVLVMNEPRHEETQGGIALYAHHFRNPNPLARVLRIGGEVEGCRPGDYVLLKMNKGALIARNNVEMTIIHEDDIVVNFGPEHPGVVNYTSEGFAQTL